MKTNFHSIFFWRLSCVSIQRMVVEIPSLMYYWFFYIRRMMLKKWIDKVDLFVYMGNSSLLVLDLNNSYKNELYWICAQLKKSSLLSLVSILIWNFENFLKLKILIALWSLDLWSWLIEYLIIEWDKNLVFTMKFYTVMWLLWNFQKLWIFFIWYEFSSLFLQKNTIISIF